MARWQDLFKQMKDLSQKGKWDDALQRASKIPSSMDPYTYLIDQASEAKSAEGTDKIVSHLLRDPNRHKRGISDIPALANYMAYNGLHENVKPETLHGIFRLDPQNSEVDRIIKHKNFSYNEDQKKLKRAHDFFKDYEEHYPSAWHFATVKSMHTGKPEKINHHFANDDIGVSDPEIIPCLRDYSKAVQHEIMMDPNIHKKIINGKPHIKLYRGINGQYASTIRDYAGLNELERTVKNKKFTIPAAPMSSWSTGYGTAENFIHLNNDDGGIYANQGVILSEWMPVENILHSSNHFPVATTKNKHLDEDEIILEHPDGKHEVSTKEMEFQVPDEGDPDGSAVLKPTLIKSEDGYIHLEKADIGKTFRNAISAATVAAMMGSSSGHPGDHLPLHQIKMNPEPIHAMKDHNPDPHDLNAIQMIESTMGKNTKHQKVNYGLNAGTSAYGKYALMPMQILDIAKYDQSIGRLHPNLLKMHHVKDQAKIKSYLKHRKALEDQLAHSHWNRLDKKFEGDRSKMAYAWKYGITGALTATPEQIANDDYVKKFHKYRSIGTLKTKLGKSEEPEAYKNSSIEYFQPIRMKPTDRYDVENINDCISRKEFRDLTQHGHFTMRSFIVGFNKDNSWLIKIDQKSRPAIEAVKYGLQSVKEAAFSDMARNVFGLGDFTPKVILGEIMMDGEKQTCAAIKMYHDVYIPAVKFDKENHDAMVGIMNQYKPDGTLHQLSAMLWILGDLDAHGKNLLTNGRDMKIIDHGSAFATDKMDVNDKDIFIPYFLRVPGGVQDTMTPEEKLERMPKVDDLSVNNELKHWIFALDIHKLLELLNIYGLDKASASRLEALRDLIEKRPDFNISQILNECWVLPWHKIEEKATYEVGS